MACLLKAALPVCVLLIRGRLAVFYVFSLAIFTTKGQKNGAMAYQRRCRHFSRVGLLLMNV